MADDIGVGMVMALIVPLLRCLEDDAKKMNLESYMDRIAEALKETPGVVGLTSPPGSPQHAAKLAAWSLIEGLRTGSLTLP